MEKRVFLTGATDGIGLALARLWVGRGERPYLSGRRPLDVLDPAIFPRELFYEERYVSADLTDADAVQQIVEGLATRGVRELDRLVLNAGMGWFGKIHEQLAGPTMDMVNVNLWAPMALTHELLPLLRAARGRIVLISSVVSALPTPDFAVYTATKAALEGFARSLRSELAGEVEVQVLRPGGTQTGMHSKSGASAVGIDPSKFPTADEVAAAIDRAIYGSPRWQTLGMGNRAARFAGRNLAPIVDRVQGLNSSRREQPS